MHELAIANSIMNTVAQEAETRNLKTVKAIGLKIGVLTDVVPEALEFGFSAITAGTALEGTRLEIMSIPVKGRCRKCGDSFGVNGLVFVCPDCGAGDIIVEQGQELDIAYIEVDDSPEAG